MARKVLSKVGAFDNDNMNAVNDNFAELYATGAGGGLDEAHILVGNGDDEATAVEVSGDAEMDNAGEVTVVGINGAAVAATGTELDAAEAIIAAIPTVDPEDGETIWNDGGVLKVASTA